MVGSELLARGVFHVQGVRLVDADHHAEARGLGALHVPDRIVAHVGAVGLRGADAAAGQVIHKCSEVSVGPEDMVFMMYKVEDLSDQGTVDSKDVVAFYCPAGVAVEIYPHTLHYAPCKVDDKGFRCLVILQKGTNGPIEKPTQPLNHEDRLIMACNKWAFGHKDSSVVATRGGFEGILGENTRIQY